MKKILIVISLFGLMFLFGCSSSMEYTTTSAQINDVIIYDFDQFKFSNINRNDLLYYVIDQAEDLDIMLTRIYDDGTIDSLLETKNGVVDTLVAISNASNVRIVLLLTYSATELNELAASNSIALTVDDIVGFIDFVAIKDRLPSSMALQRTEYLELRLERELLLVEENGYYNFQDVYTQLDNNIDYVISEKTFLEIVDDLNSIGIVYTQEELDSIEIGYDLIMSLMD